MRMAAQYAGYEWSDFQALPGTSDWVDPNNPTDDKATVLAAYRLHSLMESIRNDYDPKAKK